MSPFGGESYSFGECPPYGTTKGGLQLRSWPRPGTADRCWRVAHEENPVRYNAHAIQWILGQLGCLIGFSKATL